MSVMSIRPRRAGILPTSKVLILLVPALLVSTAAAAQGNIKGCATDTSGAALPGVEVIASGPSTQQRVVTDSSGCYGFKNIPAGTYSVTAALAGFVTGKRESVTVVNGQTVGPLDFALCVGALEYIDWILPGGLEEMWKQANAVAHVRISGTGPVRSECPNNNFEHTAVVLEVLKGSAATSLGQTVTFVQENWVEERAPYPIGQEMIIFFVATPLGFARLAGPYSVFLIAENKIDGVPTTQFLARLRTLGKR